MVDLKTCPRHCMHDKKQLNHFRETGKLRETALLQTEDVGQVEYTRNQNKKKVCFCVLEGKPM